MLEDNNLPLFIRKKKNEIYWEKKESLKEFVIKKRRIFTANMNIKIKEEET